LDNVAGHVGIFLVAIDLFPWHRDWARMSIDHLFFTHILPTHIKGKTDD